MPASAIAISRASSPSSSSTTSFTRAVLGAPLTDRLLDQALCRLYRRALPADHTTLSLLLEACSKLKALPQGMRIHTHIACRGLDRSPFLTNVIITMYGHCGSVKDARIVFESMPRRTSVSWNTMIAVYARHRQCRSALHVLQRMQSEGFRPRHSTFITALNACVYPEALPEVRTIHKSIAGSGFQSHLAVGNALINTYGKLGDTQAARKMFDKMVERDTITWNSIISAYAQNGFVAKSLQLLERMQSEDVIPDAVTFVNLLSGCTSEADLSMGIAIHEHVRTSGLESDVFVGTALVTMYGNCGCLNDARRSFDKISARNVVSWNAMIGVCSQVGDSQNSLQFFEHMLKDHLIPDSITFMNAIDSCKDSTALEVGKGIHSYAVRWGFEHNTLVRSALVRMYGRCGSMQSALCIFELVHSPDVHLWTAIIGAHSQLDHAADALKLFRSMQWEGVTPNQATFINVLSVCVNLSAVAEGKIVHSALIEEDFDSMFTVGNALITMHSSFGAIRDASNVFDRMSKGNVTTWTAMMSAYALNGHGNKALQLFKHMQQENIKPDATMFVAVLAACIQGHLLQEARHHFYSMSLVHGILPDSRHNSSMVDILCQAGRIDEAESFLKKMPAKAGVTEWLTFLSACRSCNDVSRGERAAEQVMNTDPHCAAAYIMLSDIYIAADRLDDAARLRTRMAQKGSKEQLGRSWIEIENSIHTFETADKAHPEVEDIYSGLSALVSAIEGAGYVPNTKLVLENVDEEQKKRMLHCHSEKLAVTFGLISTPPGKALHITTNFRVCIDCHNAIKIISRVAARQIFVRDEAHLHCFKDGVCSCGDYW